MLGPITMEVFDMRVWDWMNQLVQTCANSIPTCRKKDDWKIPQARSCVDIFHTIISRFSWKSQSMPLCKKDKSKAKRSGRGSCRLCLSQSRNWRRTASDQIPPLCGSIKAITNICHLPVVAEPHLRTEIFCSFTHFFKACVRCWKLATACCRFALSSLYRGVLFWIQHGTILCYSRVLLVIICCS